MGEKIVLLSAKQPKQTLAQSAQAIGAQVIDVGTMRRFHQTIAEREQTLALAMHPVASDAIMNLSC